MRFGIAFDVTPESFQLGRYLHARYERICDPLSVGRDLDVRLAQTVGGSAILRNKILSCVLDRFPEGVHTPRVDNPNARPFVRRLT